MGAFIGPFDQPDALVANSRSPEDAAVVFFSVCWLTKVSVSALHYG